MFGRATITLGIGPHSSLAGCAVTLAGQYRKQFISDQ